MSEKQPPGDKVSYNSRQVLLALFALVIVILIVFTYLVIIFPEQTGRLNTVFIAAISGSLALGGTLISQLWGKNSVVAPSVYLTNPRDGATGIPRRPTVRAFFNMQMNESTITRDTFTLREAGSDVPVQAEVRLEGGNAVLTPAADLNGQTQYTAKISKEAKSIGGDSLDNDKEWSFTTA
jgi:Bacterial Ig-like domain